MNAESRTVESVIQVASRLISVLEREIELLRAMKPRALAELQEEKMRLVTTYEEQVRSLAASPEVLRDLAPVLRDEFECVAERFNEVISENRRVLSAAGEAQRRFFDAVVKAAEGQRSSYRVYSPNGEMPSASRPPSHDRPLSLTLDRQL